MAKGSRRSWAILSDEVPLVFAFQRFTFANFVILLYSYANNS